MVNQLFIAKFLCTSLCFFFYDKFQEDSRHTSLCGIVILFNQFPIGKRTLAPALCERGWHTHLCSGVTEKHFNVLFFFYYYYLSMKIFLFWFLFMNMSEAEQLPMCLLSICISYFVIFMSSFDKKIVELFFSFLSL